MFAILLVTPYMSEPGTCLMVKAFKNFAEARGWHIYLIDHLSAASDVDRWVKEGVDAIVVNMGSELFNLGVIAANGIGIPVFGMDSDRSPRPVSLSQISSNL